MKPHFLKLTLVTNQSHFSLEKYLDFISVCAKSGLSAVQLREKNRAANDLLELGQRLMACLEPFSIPLIVNDNLDLCLQLDAKGLHLGQTDGDVHQARQALGSNKIIGLSINTLAQLELANDLPLDYVGIGAIFPTQNKPNVEKIWGLPGLKQVAKISKHPIIAIGGIDESNAMCVMQSGASGIAAIGAFHEASNPEITTQNLRKTVDERGYHDRQN